MSAPETPYDRGKKIRIIKGSRLRPTKMDIGFGFYESKYINNKK